MVATCNQSDTTNVLSIRSFFKGKARQLLAMELPFAHINNLVEIVVNTHTKRGEMIDGNRT
ncbi:MAG TPA: hypothetical protein VNW73_03150 [Ktedonobacteraceae bacterium]|nr:hypothetical protein [Ktedonobacteraceae bacterium]